MDRYERLLSEISRRGPGYRWAVTILVSVTSMKGALDLFLMSLSLSSVPHHCSTVLVNNMTLTWPVAVANFSVDEFVNITEFQCEIPQLQTQPDGSMQLLSNTSECTEWTFPEGRESLLTEFKLVCNRSYLSSRFMTLYFAVVCASMTVLPLGDVLGRRFVFVGAAFVDLACTLGFVLASDFVTVTVMHTLMGLGGSCTLVGVAIVMENVGEEYRSSHGNMMWILYVAGYILSAPVSYLLPHWRQQFGLALCVCAIGYAPFPFMPESPRWLLTRNRVKDAESHLRRICRLSHSLRLMDDFDIRKCVVPPSQVTSRPPKLTSIIKYLLTLLLLCFCYFALSLVYVALSLQSDFTTKNPYLNVFIQGCLEIPVYPFSWWAVDKFGRRPTAMATLISCGIGLVVMPLMPNSPDANFQAVNALAIFVKFSVAVAFSIAFVHSMEVLPTSLKALSFFVSAFIVRAAMLAAPELSVFMNEINPNVPVLTYGAVSIAAASVYLLMPETTGSPIPNTIADMRDLRCRFTCSAKGSVIGDVQMETTDDEDAHLQTIDKEDAHMQTIDKEDAQMQLIHKEDAQMQMTDKEDAKV